MPGAVLSTCLPELMGPSWRSCELGSSVSTLYLKKKKILILFLIYLAVLGLSGGMRDLLFSLTAACEI